jgi:hypothetical protein
MIHFRKARMTLRIAYWAFSQCSWRRSGRRRPPGSPGRRHRPEPAARCGWVVCRRGA